GVGVARFNRDARSSVDWDRWVGPAPAADYRFLKTKRRRGKTFSNAHGTFRWWYEYSGGKLTDWGAHHVDIAMWALEMNGQESGPLSIGGTAEHPVAFREGSPVETDRYNTATRFELTARVPGDVDVVIQSSGNGVLIEGDEGRILVNRGRLVGAPVEALRDDPLPEGAIQAAYKGLPMQFNERKAHWANFLDCARSRKEPISDVHSHMRMLNVCHLAGISARLGRDLKWDADREQIVGDDQANAMLARPYREGYEVEG
ncbi:MAG: gfo/Idh/MocA family oxidoreductase, partial [Planctomycetota bacterium]